MVKPLASSPLFFIGGTQHPLVQAVTKERICKVVCACVCVCVREREREEEGKRTKSEYSKSTLFPSLSPKPYSSAVSLRFEACVAKERLA